MVDGTDDPGAVTVSLLPHTPVDSDELEELSLQLREELMSLAVGSVRAESTGTAPPGAKAVDALAAGTMIITAVRSSAAVLSIVNTIRSWLKRNKQNSVRLTLNGHELEVEGLSSETQERLVIEWLARAAPTV